VFFIHFVLMLIYICSWDTIRKEKVKGFYELMMANTVRAGAANLVLTAGLGGMRPNTVIVGFYRLHQQSPQPSPPSSPQAHLQQSSTSTEALNPGYSVSVNEYVSMILDAITFEKNVLIARNFDTYDPSTITHQSKLKSPMTIDVWHVGACTGGGTDAAYKLCLQLGYVLWRADFFHKHCTLRFFALTPTAQEVATYEAQLKAILLDARVPDPVINVISLKTPQSDITLLPVSKRHSLINATIYSFSSESAVTFIPISRPPDNSALQSEYINELDQLSTNLPPTMLVYGQKVVITNEL